MWKGPQNTEQLKNAEEKELKRASSLKYSVYIQIALI